MVTDLAAHIKALLNQYDPDNPIPTANALRELWLEFTPKSTGFAKAELLEKQETVGISIPDLQSIAKELAKPARQNVDLYLPLMSLLWDEYGREGRVLALIPLGKMELAAPEKIVPILKEMCRSCITWEDADRLAMDALEPIVRQKPDEWLPKIEPWLDDENKWLKRAAITVVGRLAFKNALYVERSLELCEGLINEEDDDVKKAVSFAVRLTARSSTGHVREWLAGQIPPENPAATWVLCDIIRSMATKLLPDFEALLPVYQTWAKSSAVNNRGQKSIESAVKKLEKVAG